MRSRPLSRPQHDSWQTAPVTNQPTTGPDGATDVRAEITAAMQSITHIFVGSEFDDAVLIEVRDQMQQIDAALTAASHGPLQRDFASFFSDDEREAVGTASDGSPFGAFNDSPVTGDHNPMSYGLNIHLDDGTARATMTLGRAFEGAPGRAHGGMVAAAFDEVMGLIAPSLGTAAFTAWLKVDYLAPCPLHEELTFTASLSERDGRKITVSATATDAAGETFATAQGLFVAPRRPDAD